MLHNIRFVLFVSLALLGVVFISRQWKIYHNVPKNYEWNAVNEFLKANGDSDDLIVFEPAWLAGYAQDHGRLKLFSAVNHPEIFKKTYPPSSKLWLISMFNLSRSADQLKKAGFTKEAFHNIYSVRLIRYSVPSKETTYNFVDQLRQADVFVDYGDGKIVRAEKDNETWILRDNPIEWNQVSIRHVSFRRQIRRCIWFHPLDKGIKTIQYAKVPLGRRIELFGGIADTGMQTPPGAPVYLFVRVDGIPIGKFEFRDTDIKFYHTVDTTPFSGTEHQLSFQVQTSDYGGRHFCFSAWSPKD